MLSRDSGAKMEGAVQTYTAGGAMQSFISGGRVYKSKMSYESFILFVTESSFETI